MNYNICIHILHEEDVYASYMVHKMPICKVYVTEYINMIYIYISIICDIEQKHSIYMIYLVYVGNTCKY